MIIHVSGTTGSGKTYLGNFIRQIYDRKRLAVIDLDLLFHNILNTRQVVETKDAEERFKKIQQTLQQQIAQITRAFRNVLFVGYSDVVVDGKPRYVLFPADRRYFIEVPLPVLIQQYRDRAGQHILSTRREVKVLSDADLKRMVRTDHKLYSRYKWMPQKDIIKEIILLIGK